VTPGCEHYCPLLAEQLAAMWPGHPPLHYALPAGRTALYPRTIPTAATSWTGVLAGGLAALRERGARHVFVLLEDHVPLWPCAADLIEEVLRIAVREDLPCVVFPKYGWPPRGGEEPGAERRGLAPEVEFVCLGGQRLAKLPRDFRCYNQCQPAIWNLDYYAALLAAAARRGIEDPWAFERFVLPGQPQHYVSEYRWPSRHCGYRRRGRVYLRALYSMKLPEGGALRDALLGERFPRVPAPVRRALGAGLSLWGRLRRVGRRFERRPSPVWPNAPAPAASRPSAGLGVDAPPETARLHGAPPAARVPR
jgi:hypothetical protein